jgi:hypothetical protein
MHGLSCADTLLLLFTPVITVTDHFCLLCPFTAALLIAAPLEFTGMTVPLLPKISNPMKRGCTDA